MPKFNERLKYLRHEANLSQAELAKQIGISKSSINMYERGEREPGLETLEAFADYFNVDMDYLLGKSECKQKSSWSMGSIVGQQNDLSPSKPQENTISLIGRDGTKIIKTYSDEQMETIRRLLDAIPSEDSDL